LSGQLEFYNRPDLVFTLEIAGDLRGRQDLPHFRRVGLPQLHLRFIDRQRVSQQFLGGLIGNLTLAGIVGIGIAFDRGPNPPSAPAG
jgi:hypothetical protein